MTFVDRPLLRIVFALILIAFAPSAFAAEASYPDRAVRIVLPFAAGGVADITARIIAEKLGDRLGQRFYVENQPGAGGIAAARTVISSAPDGYTLALLSNGTAISVSLFRKLPFDPLRDFAPISSLGFFDFIFATGAASEFKTLADFIAAARTVISSAPDGYTLALLSNGTAISVSLFKKLPFDPLRDFAPISSLGFFDFIFATGAASEFKTLADFIAAAKAKPGALNVGTINIGSSQNLSAELFKTAAGIDFTIIPYRATPEVQVSLLQGDIALMIDSYSAMKGNLADRKFRPLASSGPKRSESTPDIATLRESGVAGYDVVSWNALFAPAGTPPEIVTKLNGALREILADADVKKRLLELGIEAKASSPEEISARLKSDIDKWQKVIEKAGIQKQ